MWNKCPEIDNSWDWNIYRDRYCSYCVFYIYEGEVQMKNYGNRKMWGNPRTKECFKDYRCFDESNWLLSKQNGVTERNRSQERHSRRRKVLSGECAKHSGIPGCCGRNLGRRTEPLQITVIWLSTDSRYSKAAVTLYQKEFWYRGKGFRVGGRWVFLTKMCLPSTARVSAETRDENEWDAHDVWEFRR